MEFSDELSALEGKPYESIRLDTVYTRITGIAGQPLNDNNLGQTLINNYGRPYQEGFNNYTGFSARADDGRFSYYVSGEYQHSPSAPPYPLSARLAIASVNLDPVQPATPFPEINQFRLLDTYVSTKLLGQDISIGKQSLDWGPSESGSMLMSNNAEPFWMLRINQTEPLYIPGVSKVFGSVPSRTISSASSPATTSSRRAVHLRTRSSASSRSAAIRIGMDGHHPFQGIEISFARTNVFAGRKPRAADVRLVLEQLHQLRRGAADVKFSRNDPGARFASFDFSWQVWNVDQHLHRHVHPRRDHAAGRPAQGGVQSRASIWRACPGFPSSTCGWKA